MNCMANLQERLDAIVRQCNQRIANLENLRQLDLVALKKEDMTVIHQEKEEFKEMKVISYHIDEMLANEENYPIVDANYAPLSKKVEDHLSLMLKKEKFHGNEVIGDDGEDPHFNDLEVNLKENVGDTNATVHGMYQEFQENNPTQGREVEFKIGPLMQWDQYFLITMINADTLLEQEEDQDQNDGTCHGLVAWIAGDAMIPLVMFFVENNITQYEWWNHDKVMLVIGAPSSLHKKTMLVIWNWYYKLVKGKEMAHPGNWNMEWKIAWLITKDDTNKSTSYIKGRCTGYTSGGVAYKDS